MAGRFAPRRRLAAAERPQDGVQDLELGNGEALGQRGIEAGKGVDRPRRNVLQARDPTVSLAEQADEERPAGVDAAEKTDVDDSGVPGGVMLSDAPTQVDVHHAQAAALAPVAQAREDLA